METPVIHLAWQLDPVLIGSLVTVSLCYGLAIGPLRKYLAPKEDFPLNKALIFYAAVLVTYLTEGSPLHDLSERYLLSAHMVQHLLITYLCAPLFIWGMPSWLLRPLLLNPFSFPIAKQLSKPVTAALIFNFFLSVWHFPAIYDAGLRNSSLHHSQHILFMLVSLIGWWPIMSPLKALPRLSYGAQMIYLFVTATVLQLPLFAIMTFSDHAFYASYQNAPRLWFATALDDQIAAGVIMKILAMFIYSIPLIVIFSKWYAESQRKPLKAAS